MAHQIKAFYYKDKLYIRAIPSKQMFHSTMVHEVVNRGDVFAMRVEDQVMTVVPGSAKVTHVDITLPLSTPLTLQPMQDDLFGDAV